MTRKYFTAHRQPPRARSRRPRKKTCYAREGTLLPAALLSEEVQEVRFWQYVTRGAAGACWSWDAGRASAGFYGAVQIFGIWDYAHFWAWRFTHPALPRPRYLGRLCLTGGCCNPAHYEAGVRHWSQKVPVGAHAQIFEEYENGATQAEIARRFGVSQQNISHILRRQT